MNFDSEVRPLSKDDIGADFRDLIRVQSYDVKEQIEGVRLIDLRLFPEDGGDFCEVVRHRYGEGLTSVPGYVPAQVSYSSVLPGTIKAWHLHLAQDDLWFVPPTDRLLVGLLDLRESSATYRATMRFVMGGGGAGLLLVPRGVAHGTANLGTQPSHLFYFTNTQFDSDSPDEYRLPFDHLGADFWKIQAG